MNKNDFLDILKDYLKNNFSTAEINDILRDYEEFFLNGELEGKTEEDIIKALGSPKAIANELIEEMKGNKEENNKSSSKSYKEFFCKLKNKVKYYGEKVVNKTKDFLNSSDIINDKIPTWSVKLIILFLTLILIIPALMFLACAIGTFFTLLGITIFNIASYGCTIPMAMANGYLAVFIGFLSLTLTGVLIAFWTIYVNILKLFKYLFVKYTSWVKTRKMYIRVKENSNGKEKNKDYEYTENYSKEEEKVENKNFENTEKYSKETMEKEGFSEKEKNNKKDIEKEENHDE